MMNIEKIQDGVRLILEGIGEDLEREGLRGTPERVARMYGEVFRGVNKNPAEVIKIFREEKHEELIMVKDIPFFSFCEHHLLPFIGTATVAYIPNDFIITGISKLARVVDIISKRPQLQERLTTETANTLMTAADPGPIAAGTSPSVKPPSTAPIPIRARYDFFGASVNPSNTTAR